MMMKKCLRIIFTIAILVSTLFVIFNKCIIKENLNLKTYSDLYLRSINSSYENTVGNGFNLCNNINNNANSISNDANNIINNIPNMNNQVTIINNKVASLSPLISTADNLFNIAITSENTSSKNLFRKSFYDKSC